MSWSPLPNLLARRLPALPLPSRHVSPTGRSAPVPAPTGSERSETIASIQSGEFLRTLLCLSGAALLVVGQVNLPRRQRLAELEARRDALATELAAACTERARYARLGQAFRHDAHYRRVILAWALDHRPGGARTVEEYVRDPEGHGPGPAPPLALVE